MNGTHAGPTPELEPSLPDKVEMERLSELFCEVLEMVLGEVERSESRPAFPALAVVPEKLVHSSWLEREACRAR